VNRHGVKVDRERKREEKVDQRPQRPPVTAREGTLLREEGRNRLPAWWKT